MSNYFNEAGEPLMDGSAMRYEMYLDSMDEPYRDPYDDYVYDREPEYVDPEDCDHADKSWSGWTVRCDSGCEAEGIAIVKPDWFAGDTDIEDVILWNI